MLVVYLLFLLHLSAASTCGATSRNHRLFLPGGAAAPAPSPAIHDHRSVAISKDYYLSYYNVRHYHPVMMARRGGPPPPQPSPGARVEGAPPPPPPPPPGVEASGVEGAPPPPPPPPQKEDSAAAMEPSPPPPPQQADGGGGEGGTSSEVDTGTDDVAVDYEGPKTHPPSHN